MAIPDWRRIVSRINEENIEEFKTKALEGDPIVQSGLGSYYSSPRRENYPEAKKWFAMAAELGFAPAQTVLASWYMDGFHIEKNTQEGLRLYNLAIESGYVEAMVRLGYHYLRGRDLKQDKKEVFRLFKLAAEQGGKHYLLGQCYYNGDGVEQNYEEAVKLFNMGIKWNDSDEYEGDYTSAYYLAECYYYGRGVERNVEKAAALWEAIALGHYGIYEKLADLYSNGIDMDPNYEKAAYWLWEFITNDEGDLVGSNTDHTYRLATYCYEGKGVNKNRTLALKLFKLTVDSYHRINKEFYEDEKCPISAEPDFVINARKMLVKHGRKGIINDLQKAALKGDGKAKEILEEFGIELIKPKPAKVVEKKEEPAKPVFEKTPPKPPIAVSVGEKVSHDSFGEGTVEEVKENRIIVKFKNGAEKTFVNPDAFDGGFLKFVER